MLGYAFSVSNIAVQEKSAWWLFGSTMDADFEKNRFFFAGQQYATEVDFLTAIGGVKTGNTYAIGPIDVSNELMQDANFDSGIIADGWQEGSGYTSVGEISYDNGQLKVDRSATGQYRFAFPYTQAEMRAYRFKATITAHTNNILPSPGNAWVGIGSSDANLWGARSTFGFTNLPTVPDSAEVIYGAEKTTFWSGLNTNIFAIGAAWIDNCSLKEVAPFIGFMQNGATFAISGTTPVAASAEQVIFQLDDETSERSRIRLVWEASKNLRLIITWAGTEQANIDFGIVDINTNFSVRFAGKKDELYARLDDGNAISATPSQFPGLATLRIARSFTGEHWAGTVARIASWSGYQPSKAIDANKAFAVYGDSFASGAGASNFATSWYSLLYTGYAPDRIAYRNATGGQSITDMANSVLADAIHRDWISIFYDRKNTGETADLWLEQITIAINHLQTSRFLIMPQVPYANGAEDPANQLILDEINTRIRANWSDNTFSLAEETTFLADLTPSATRSDGLHRNDVGQAIEANTIRTWLDNKGW